MAPGACPPLPVSPPPRCPEDPHSARPPVSTATHDPFPRPPTLARKLAGARRLAGRVPAGRPAGKGPGAVWGAQGGRPRLPLGNHSGGRRGVLPAPRWRGPVGGEGREETSFSWGRRRAPRPRGERPPRTSRRPAGSPRGRAGGGRRLLAAGLGRAALSPGSGLPCRVLFALLLRASPPRRRQPAFPSPRAGSVRRPALPAAGRAADTSPCPATLLRRSVLADGHFTEVPPRSAATFLLLRCADPRRHPEEPGVCGEQPCAPHRRLPGEPLAGPGDPTSGGRCSVSSAPAPCRGEPHTHGSLIV